jgi:hypothetical protein
MVDYPKHFGLDYSPADGAAGRLQNFLLWDGVGGGDELQFWQIFGNPDKLAGLGSHGFYKVIRHCWGRIIPATQEPDGDGKCYLDPDRKNKVRRLAKDLEELLTPANPEEEGITLQDLMLTENANLDPDVKSYSRELEYLGISLPYMHRLDSDIPALTTLFEGSFYPELGEKTPRWLFTTAYEDLTPDQKDAVLAAKEAHALQNHPDLPDRVDPRKPV